MRRFLSEHPQPPAGTLAHLGTAALQERHLGQDLCTALAATLRHCTVLATDPDVRLAATVDFTFTPGARRLQISTFGGG